MFDPAALDEPGAFERRLEAMLDALVAAPTAPGTAGRVLIPGEPEAAAEQRADRSGIALDGPHVASLVTLGARLGQPFPLPPASGPTVPRP